MNKNLGIATAAGIVIIVGIIAFQMYDTHGNKCHTRRL